MKNNTIYTSLTEEDKKKYVSTEGKQFKLPNI